MNLNFEIARELMVLNQLKPNKISEQNILNIFKNTPKENFYPKSLEIFVILTIILIYLKIEDI